MFFPLHFSKNSGNDITFLSEFDGQSGPIPPSPSVLPVLPSVMLPKRLLESDELLDELFEYELLLSENFESDERLESESCD